MSIRTADLGEVLAIARSDNFNSDTLVACNEREQVRSTQLARGRNGGSHHDKTMNGRVSRTGKTTLRTGTGLADGGMGL